MFDLLHNASVKVLRPSCHPRASGNPSRGESRLDARFRGHDSLTLKTAKRKAR